MTDDSVKRRALEARVERWTTDAKKLIEAGEDDRALELYRLAADDLPGAPWLQHRTAELARKLKRPEVAISYFRRASTAFQLASFSQRAVAPLRTAWSLSIERLPASSKLLVELAGELIQLQRRLGFTTDASVTLERTNAALRARGFSEMAALSAAPRQPTSAPDSAPPGSTTQPTGPATSTLPSRVGRG